MNNLFIDIISLLLMNQPFIIKLPKVEIKNLDFYEKKENIIFSNVLTYPLFTLGFHSFIHRTRSAMEITKNLQSKTDFYYVVNPFEPTISNFEDDIKKSTELFLSFNLTHKNSLCLLRKSQKKIYILIKYLQPILFNYLHFR
jgi:hypothetical protein